MRIIAVEYIRPMRGGAQSHLIRADDDHCYVVKFLNNPQHPRVLANEWLAARLAQFLGLPVPEIRQVEVSEELVRNSPSLRIRTATSVVHCSSGLQFGSRYAVSDPHAPVFDYLPGPGLESVENLNAFAGMLLFDKWTCNCDGRQVVCSKTRRNKGYWVQMVDQGFCFNAGDWSFPDSPLRGIYSRHDVYANISGWRSFQPWLERLERVDESVICQAAGEIPEAWYGRRESINWLLGRLLLRRARVPGLIWDVKVSPIAPFVNWRPGRASVAA